VQSNKIKLWAAKSVEQESIQRYKLDGPIFLCGDNVSVTLRDVRLPADLCQKAEAKFGQQFANIEELVTFILGTILSEDARDMDEAESRIVEDRLRDLGYI
jgi:hypothetical protein